MRIAIDSTPLLLRSAGVKTYVYNWFRTLRSIASGDTILAWPYLSPGEDYSHEKSLVSRQATYARLALLHAANGSPLRLLDWIGPNADVFHASQQLMRPPRNGRVTATLHDMTCWIVPETHSAANVRGARLFAERVLKRADGLIAVSENSRLDAIKILGIAPDKIVAIYPGLAPAFFCAKKTVPTRPYILFVGTIEPRKNINTLLDAYAQLPRSIREEFDLVIAGPTGWGHPATLRRLQSGEAGVRYLGYVPEQDLPGLTAAATIFVYPSLYEGFGLPLGQAMAAGVPSITSNLSSLPEVAGDAALLVDPRSPAELAAAIERLLLSPDLRATLALNGKARAQRYTWENAARESLEFFHRLC